MSKRKGPRALELPLDLPLHANDEQDAASGALLLDETPGAPQANAADLLIGLDEDDPDETRGAAATDGGETGTVGASFEDLGPVLPAPFRDRLLSGLLDLGIQLLVLGATVAAVHVMGIALSPDHAPAFAVLGLIFSFLYWFIPLAFWGQTPGMAWVGNSATSLTDEPLTFGQSVLRWLGALLTLALAGTPLLLVFTGRSLSDRISESKTVLL